MATATQLAQARQLFDVYATGLEPTESALNFWADAIANQGLAGATNSFLNPSDPNAPRLGIMRNDPEYLAATRPPPEVNPNPYSGEGSFQQTVGTQGNIRSLNLGDDFQEYEEIGTDGPYTIYRVRSAYGDDLGTIRVQTGGGIPKLLEGIAPLLGFAAGAAGLGGMIGSALGLTGTAATSVGNAIASGLITGAITGDAEKALIAGALAGLGTAAVESGLVGDAMDTLGLSEYKDTFGVLNSNQVKDVDFIAADAKQLADQGLSNAAIQQNLIASGVNPVVAAGAADLAASGATVEEIKQDVIRITGGKDIYGEVDTEPGTDITKTTGDPTKPGIEDGKIVPDTVTPPVPPVPPVDTVTPVTPVDTVTPTTTVTPTDTGVTPGPGPGGTPTPSVNIPGIPSWATGLLTALQNFDVGGLLNTGIDYAVQQRQIEQLLGVGNEAQQRLAALASKSALTPAEYQELNTLAQQVKTETAAAGQASQVPFTPYTMTTGFGTTGVTPTGATATTAPEYEALRQQSLGLAGQTLGAINPAQAAETLYGQIETLAAPGREREQLALQQRLQRQGLLGFGTTLPTTGGGARTVNPLFESLLSAQETARAQQALQAQQFGTTEAARQAALAQGLLGQAQGIDQQTLAQLQTTGQLGINLNQLEQANRARALQAQLAGISAPLTTGLASSQLRQTDLARQAQLNQFGELLRSQAAWAALSPQQQQTEAAGVALQGLLNPVTKAITTAVQELFK